MPGVGVCLSWPVSGAGQRVTLCPSWRILAPGRGSRSRYILTLHPLPFQVGAAKRRRRGRRRPSACEAWPFARPTQGMATRVFVALSGSDDFSIIKVDLSGEEAAVRSRLIQAAAEELEVSIADESAVKIYLKDRLVKRRRWSRRTTSSCFF